MTVRERQRSGLLADFSVCFQLMLSYRMPMKVKDVMVFPRFPEKDDIYYLCPRCQKLLDREFMAYCDRCGQCLDWHDYRKAKRMRFKAKK